MNYEFWTLNLITFHSPEFDSNLTEFDFILPEFDAVETTFDVIADEVCDDAMVMKNCKRWSGNGVILWRVKKETAQQTGVC